MKINPLVLFILAAVSISCSRKEICVDDGIPAGNIVFERISNDTVFVHQELRDTQRDWFYWAFRVKGAEGKKLTFIFTRSIAVNKRGPVVSLDQGKNYEFLAEEGATSHSFTYTFPKNAKEVWFYECFPYTPQMWNSFISAHETGKFESKVLCKSRNGVDVPYYRIAQEDSDPKLKVVVSARHHCSETHSTYVAEGIMDAFLEDSESGDWLRKNIELYLVPFIDIDGAIAGDQGKGRMPHDHNQDYIQFIYPETAAFAALMTEVQPDIFLDLHNPELRSECIYSPLAAEPGPLEEAFAKAVEKYQEGGLNYRTSDDIPFGTSWNTADTHKEAITLNARKWVNANIRSIKVSRTFEVPFNYANGSEIYPEKLRQFGHGLTRAIKAIAEE